MHTTTFSLTDVASRLRAARYGKDLFACAFRVWQDETLGEVVEVVLILDHAEWDDAAIKSCERATKLTDLALAGLECFALPVCRTRSEHESFRAREDGLWTAVELDGAC
jgi:hypothetical protein